MWLGLRVFAFFLAVSYGYAGAVRGSIVDKSGAAVPGARATLYNAARIVLASVQSDATGGFAVSPVSPGRYLLVISRPGFSDQSVPVSVQTDGDAVLKVELGLSPVETEISVSAGAGEIEADAASLQRLNIIPRGELAERSISVLTEVAEGEAGLQQVRTSPGMGSFLVRGLTGNKVAVYRDGIRYTTSAQRGGVSTFQNLIDASTLESAEFLRGPNSGPYGSDSLGGVVNLVSRGMTFGAPGAKNWNAEIEPVFTSISNGGGTSALFSHSGKRLGFVSTVAGRRMSRFRAGRGLESHSAVTRFFGLPSDTFFGSRLPDTAVTQYGGSFHGQVTLTPTSQLVVHYERGQQDGGKRWDQLDGGDGNLIADLRNLMLDFGYLRYHRGQTGFLHNLSLSGSFNAQREERVNQGGNGNPRGAITHQYEKAKVWGGQALGSRSISTHTFAGGGEIYWEEMTAPAFAVDPVRLTTVLTRPRVPDGATYLNHGMFLQDTWSPVQTLRLSGAIRFGGATYKSVAPSDSLTSNAFSGRAGGVWTIRGPVSIHSYYSRGFRAPNMTDLGTLGLQGNGVFEANYNDLSSRGALIGDRADDRAVSTGLPVQRVRPETSDGVDIGGQVQTSRMRADFTAFWIRLGNTILSQTLLLPQGATGSTLGDQIIARQLASGAVFVPASTSPVLVRANFSGARLRGFEHSLRLRVHSTVTFHENLTWIYAEDSRTGIAPDIEPGIPPLIWNSRLLWTPTHKRVWLEAYSTLAGRQDRLSSLSLSDRRIGASRSRANIASYFNNGATARGYVAGGRLLATGETLAQVQDRVLGSAQSAPLFNAIPGWGTIGLRVGAPMGERSELFVDLSNLTDKNYRTIGSGLDGAGRSVTVKWRLRF